MIPAHNILRMSILALKKFICKKPQGRSQDFWQGERYLERSDRQCDFFSRVRRHKALPIELRLGSGGAGLYVNFKPGE